MNNLEIYNKLKQVPKEYLKTIQAGRLKGMSDIKPQWRIMKLTEVFGMCGFGWKISDVRFEYKEKNEEIVVICKLNLFVKVNDEWSEAICGVGGSKFSTQESRGTYTSDEAEKMAYTDAISVASKMLGLASDVYMWHGGKYGGCANNVQKNTDTNEGLPWLNIIDSKGENTEKYREIEKSISEGINITLDGIRKKYRVSKQTQEQLKQSFNIE